jgi:hypothetical protein
MVSMEDVASKIGHGGKIGPCGYVDLDIVPESSPSGEFPNRSEAR